MFSGELLSFGQRLDAKASEPVKKHKAPAPSRENKNRPQEMSSNRMPKRFRVASGLKAGELERNQIRDPRFADATIGETSDGSWQTKYSFVADMRHAEVKELQERLATSKAAYKRRGRNGAQRERLRQRAHAARGTERARERL